jgi:hypothetical protein
MTIIATVNRTITAPEPIDVELTDITWFLGGGITGCPDWQSILIALLADHNVVLLNPRRPNFDITDPSASDEQVDWEHKGLSLATGRLFWFPRESICPITLFELGAWAYQKHRPLVVGADPEYPRIWDVTKQLSLVRPELEVVDSLEALAHAVKAIEL